MVPELSIGASKVFSGARSAPWKILGEFPYVITKKNKYGARSAPEENRVLPFSRRAKRAGIPLGVFLLGTQRKYEYGARSAPEKNRGASLFPAREAPGCKGNTNTAREARPEKAGCFILEI